MNRDEVRRLAEKLGRTVRELTHYLKEADIKVSNSPVYSENDILTAVEFGYRAHEKGQSLLQAIKEARK